MGPPNRPKPLSPPPVGPKPPSTPGPPLAPRPGGPPRGPITPRGPKPIRRLSFSPIGGNIPGLPTFFLGILQIAFKTFKRRRGFLFPPRVSSPLGPRASATRPLFLKGSPPSLPPPPSPGPSARLGPGAALPPGFSPPGAGKTPPPGPAAPPRLRRRGKPAGRRPKPGARRLFPAAARSPPRQRCSPVVLARARGPPCFAGKFRRTGSASRPRALFRPHAPPGPPGPDNPPGLIKLPRRGTPAGPLPN